MNNNCFSHNKRMIRHPIRIANDVFSCVRKIIHPIESHVCSGALVSCQVSSLLRVLAAPNCFVCCFTVIQSENLLSERCSRSWNRIAWNYFMVTNEKKIAESLEKQSKKRKKHQHELYF